MGVKTIQLQDQELIELKDLVFKSIEKQKDLLKMYYNRLPRYQTKAEEVYRLEKIEVLTGICSKL